MRQLLIILYLSAAARAWAQGTIPAPADAAAATATYMVKSPTDIHAIVRVRTLPENVARAVVIPLPFISKPGTCRSQSTLTAFTSAGTNSSAIAIVPAGRSELEFECAVQTGVPEPGTVRVVQGTDKFILIVPTPPRTLRAELGEAAGDVLVIGAFTSVSARLPSGFTLPTETTDVVLKADSELPLQQNQRAGTYELHFRPPASAWMQGLDSILQSLLVFVFALLITIASPGVVPATYYFRVVNAFAILIVAFLAIRWFTLTRSSKPLLPLFTDSVLAACYFAVAYGLPSWRKIAAARGGHATRS